MMFLFFKIQKEAVVALVQLNVGDGLNILEFDDEWSSAKELSALANEFVFTSGPLLGHGCSTEECVAALICGEMAEIAGRRRLARIQQLSKINDIIEAIDGADRLRGIAQECCTPYLLNDCPVLAKVRNAERLVALAEALGANWLGVSGYMRGLEASKRALFFSDTNQTKAEAKNIYELFAGLIETSFAAFEQRTYGKLLDELTALLQNSSNTTRAWQEGGLAMSHLNLIPQGIISSSNINFGISVAKRECWVQNVISAMPFNAIEIGFNLGHSSAMVLTLTNARLKAFDICRYDYTLAARDHLIAKFPTRFELFCGDSNDTLRSHLSSLSAHDPLVDFVFIDGSHYHDAVVADIRNSRYLARHDALVIVDDCTGEVYQAWQEARDANLLRDRHRGLCWRQLCIGNFIK